MKQFNHKYRQAGYTALEILVVLMIMSLFSTFAILSYSSYRKQARLKSAAQSVESVLATARTLAINQNAYFQVCIDITNRQFWIDELDRRGRIIKPKVTGVKWLPEDVLFSEVRKNGFSYYSGIVPICFHPSSSAEYASIYIIGENADGSQSENYFTVRVYPSTGLTHIFGNQRK